jgi:hypothetical protein
MTRSVLIGNELLVFCIDKIEPLPSPTKFNLKFDTSRKDSVDMKGATRDPI